MRKESPYNDWPLKKSARTEGLTGRKKNAAIEFTWSELKEKPAQPRDTGRKPAAHRHHGGLLECNNERPLDGPSEKKERAIGGRHTLEGKKDFRPSRKPKKALNG